METAVRRYPEDPLVWYKYGDALLHMGVRGGRWPDSAQVAFERAIALDSTQPDALEHAKLLAFQLDGAERVSLFVSAMLALDPTGAKGEALRVEAAVLDSGLTPEDLAVRGEQMSRPAMAEILADLARSPFLGAHLVALLRTHAERFPEAGPVAPLRLAYRGHLAEASVLAGPQGFAAAEIAVLRASPESLLAFADRQLLRPGSFQDGTMFPLVIRLAEMGELERVRKAIGLAPPEFGSSPMGRRMEGEVNAFMTAVARGDTAAAMNGWENRSPLLRVWLFDLAYARLLTGSGRHQDALEVLEPLGMAVLNAYTAFPSMVMLILERGRIHERVGNREQALRDYGYVRNVWSTADAVLQPLVREATDAVTRLTAERQR